MDAFSMVFGEQGPHQDQIIACVFVVVLLGYAGAAWGVRRLLMGRPARRLWWAAFMVAYVLFFFGAMEAAVRFAGPPAHPFLEPHPVRVWKLRPHLDVVEATGRLITNSRGHRNREEFEAVPPPNALRVLCLGDSWMYGFRADQDESIPAVLARNLQKAFPDRRVEVINAGVFGYGASQALSTLEEAMALQPHVVVIGLLHNLNSQAACLAGRTVGQRWTRDLLQRSYFYLWLRLKLRPRLRGWEGAAAQDGQLFRSLGQDYAAMADRVHAGGALCVFLDYRSPPDDWPGVHPVEKPGNHPESPLETEFDAVAREKGCVLVSASFHFEPGGTALTDLVNDRSHPSARGYSWMAGRVSRAIVENLSGRK